MAESRRCGYCREVGHQVRHCVRKNGERDLIKKFVYEEPLRIYAALCRAGFGEGAMIRCRDSLAQVLPYSTEVSVPLWGGKIVKRTFLGDLIEHNNNEIVAYKNVKYTKQVNFALRSPMPEGEVCYGDRYRQNGVYVYVYLPLLILENGGRVERMHFTPANIFKYLKSTKDGLHIHEYNVQSGRREYEKMMVEPSYDSPPLIIPDELRSIPEGVYLHKRLK